MIYEIDAVSAYPEMDSVEWRIEGFKGWAIEYAIVTDHVTGAVFTPIDRDFYLRHQPS